ncbi:hypothetical protein [Comamonas kerstersii]|uniref:hypothetical protein n=1 Tax=Comamonas kerstersii TaxID=225992 RepID=UPI001B323F45|nr:hypothetical protein [Comamonas kerstersii]QTW17620.1 hypothetical protein H8N02_10100 [Comamonas kerstersii]
MIKHVKPTRLPICRGLVAFALGCLALNAGAAEIPFEGQRNTIEYKQAGNTYTWSPVTGETPKSGIPYRPDLAKGAVSDTEPKVKWSPRLPYEHKGGDAAKVNIRASVDPAKVAAKAKDAIKAGAAGLASGGGYVALASIACTLLCDAAIEALKDWGVSGLSLGDDVAVSVADSSYRLSDGSSWYFTLRGSGVRSDYYYTPDLACQAGVAQYDAVLVEVRPYGSDSYICAARGPQGQDWYSLVSVHKTSENGCPLGNYISPSGDCVSELPSVNQPLSDYLTGNYVGKGWSHHWAKMTAEIVAANGNVFTDGTSVEITGPSIVPLSTSETRSSVNLIPGTNTPAPVGHTGPTDPGTQTTTSTTTAKNVYNPAPFGTGSGPSMTTGQQVQTTTNITNNVTNSTTTNTTTVTETDKAPEKEQEDFCEKNPDSLACAEADTPEAEIPEGQINISYEYADIFGNGACPADVYLTTHGQSLKVWDWQSTCSNVQTYFRPVLIACCAFIAFVIVSAGAKE